MNFSKRTLWVSVLVAIFELAGVGAVIASGATDSGGAPGQIDDGKELLGQASISLEEALKAA